MASEGTESSRRVQRLEDVSLRVDQDNVFQVEFSINELVKKLVPEGGLAAYCSGCHGCSGCSM